VCVPSSAFDAPLLALLGGQRRRKNLPLLVQAFRSKRRRQGMNWLFAGPSRAPRARLEHVLGESGARPASAFWLHRRRLFGGSVSQCHATYFPLLYEGFGSNLGAMACGAPTLTCRRLVSTGLATCHGARDCRRHAPTAASPRARRSAIKSGFTTLPARNLELACARSAPK